MESETMEVVLDGLSVDDWFVVNTNFIGYYRIQYDKNDHELLAQAIEKKSLCEIDRLGLISDIFALIQCGKTSVIEGLKFVLSFKNEESYSIWSIIISNLNKVEVLIATESYFEKFKFFVRDLLSAITLKVGWDPVKDEKHSTGLLRQLIIRKMGKFGDEAIKKEAELRFTQHISGGVQIQADLLDPVYRIMMAYGNQSTFDQLIKMFKETDLTEEKERLLSALGTCPNKDMIQDALNFGYSDEVRNNDFPRLFGAVASNKVGRGLAWEYFKANYEDIYKRYYPGSIMIKLIQQALYPFTTKDEAREVEEFFKSHPNPSERTVKQGIEEILLNASWMERDGDALKNYFSA